MLMLIVSRAMINTSSVAIETVIGSVTREVNQWVRIRGCFKRLSILPVLCSLDISQRNKRNEEAEYRFCAHYCTTGFDRVLRLRQITVQSASSATRTDVRPWSSFPFLLSFFRGHGVFLSLTSLTTPH
jgi:hypothetical protein